MTEINDETKRERPPSLGRPPLEWRTAFLNALRQSGVITYSCRAAGASYSTYYRAVKNDPIFAAEVETAMEEAVDVLEIVARQRATKGVTRPIYQGGKHVGDTQEYSDTLLIFLLKGARPEKYRDNHKVDVTSNGETLGMISVVEVVKPSGVDDADDDATADDGD